MLNSIFFYWCHIFIVLVPIHSIQSDFHTKFSVAHSKTLIPAFIAQLTPFHYYRACGSFISASAPSLTSIQPSPFQFRSSDTFTAPLGCFIHTSIPFHSLYKCTCYGTSHSSCLDCCFPWRCKELENNSLNFTSRHSEARQSEWGDILKFRTQ